MNERDLILRGAIELGNDTFEFPSTKLSGFSGEVILTQGMTQAGGGRVYGVFESVRDAIYEDADRLCLGTIGESQLTDKQIGIAVRNSASISRGIENLEKMAEYAREYRKR